MKKKYVKILTLEEFKELYKKELRGEDEDEIERYYSIYFECPQEFKPKLVFLK